MTRHCILPPPKQKVLGNPSQMPKRYPVTQKIFKKILRHLRSFYDIWGHFTTFVVILRHIQHFYILYQFSPDQWCNMHLWCCFISIFEYCEFLFGYLNIVRFYLDIWILWGWKNIFIFSLSPSLPSPAAVECESRNKRRILLVFLAAPVYAAR